MAAVNKKGVKLLRPARIALAALFLLLLAAAFSGAAAWAARLTRVEFAPALLRSCAAFSAGALAVVLLLLATTWLFGRFYCAFLCPLGICQDLVGWLSRREARREKDHAVVRCLLAGISFGVLAGGWTLPFLLLDPYSNFGRAASGASLSYLMFKFGGVPAGWIVFAVVMALAVWKKRIFCTTVCPVGTLLGLVGRFGLFKVRFTDKCVKCGLCVKSCPSGCIDPAAGIIDNERCVRCLNCLSVCRLGGVEFSARRQKKPEQTPVPDKSRREFLIRGGVLLTGLAAGFAAARLGAVGAVSRMLSRTKALFLPPGAGDMERFAMKCTACQLCTANCPAKIIVPAPGGYGPVRLTQGACRYECNKCASVCPTGAILPLTLKEKQHTRIGVVKFYASDCVVCRVDDRHECGRCAAACPTGAITLKGNPGVPKVDARLCIGCGACQWVCVAAPRAMRVHPVAKQTRIPENVPPPPIPKPGILPPGAGDAARFVASCAGCGICVAECTGKVIKPIPGGDGTVHLDLSQGACQYFCSKCSAVCPTGAIRKLDLEEKQHTKIAEAKFNAKLCLACHGDEPCGKCAGACPAGAIRPVGPRRVPRLNKKLCIGCGACQAACPAAPKAMTVVPIAKQIRIGS